MRNERAVWFYRLVFFIVFSSACYMGATADPSVGTQGIAQGPKPPRVQQVTVLPVAIARLKEEDALRRSVEAGPLANHVVQVGVGEWRL